MDIMALISDIHGNKVALEAVLDDIKSKGIASKNIYCLGDIVGYGPDPNGVIELLKSNHITTVLGNYDEAIGFYLPSCGCHINSEIERIKTMNSLTWTDKHTSEKNKAFLRELDENIVINRSGKSILLTHATPYSINDYIYENNMEEQSEIVEELEEDILIYGHTHLPYFKKIGHKYIINAGSVGRPKGRDYRANYVLLKIDKDINVEFVRVTYDVERVAREIENSDLLNEFADYLRKIRVD